MNIFPESEYEFVLPGPFRQQLGAYAKKYRYLFEDFGNFLKDFDHRLGRTISHCGGAQKIRMRSTDKQKGKSGSFRIIYFLKVQHQVTFLDIYDKGFQVDLIEREKKKIREIIKRIRKTPA
jgi:mRNA-degrading endonuclease RelE of RelBE toxin-antitoxin system